MSIVDGVIKAPRDCDHQWLPVSMVFEAQNLDSAGRVLIRQPDMLEGRVYLVCLECASHTYTSTSWIGYRLYGSEDANPRYKQDPEDPNNMVERNKERWLTTGYHRRGFNAPTSEDNQ